MIPKECKRLAEVDFPIAAVSKHSAREKSIRHGHPSTLHMWWARRPLAACRAMLMALLLPDPCDSLCPDHFKGDARKALTAFSGRPTRWNDQIQSDEGLRQILLEFIADFANWDNAAKPAYLSTARALVKAAHPDETPLVVDPFAGGGSIPLEAIRIGCDAFASDLNPVACFILRTMIVDIPRSDRQLADEFKEAASRFVPEIKSALSEFYPNDSDGMRPVVYLWARTVHCESPGCDCEIPLIRSFWLSKRTGNKCALRLDVGGADNGLLFSLFEPKNESEVQGPTVSRAKATCPRCGVVLAPERVRSQLSAHHGGANAQFDSRGQRIGGARLLAVVTQRAGETRRNFRLPTDADYNAIRKAQSAVEDVMREWQQSGRNAPCPFPDDPLPLMSGTFNVPLYGINRWRYLYSDRQALSLYTIVAHVRKLWENETTRHLAPLFGCAVSLFARCCNSGARIRPDSSVAPAFGMQALPITWTYPETIPWGGRAEHFEGALDTVLEVLQSGMLPTNAAGEVQSADACESPLPTDSCHAWFTDPPYYFAIPYADLSDFFFTWLVRALPEHPVLRDPFDAKNTLTPKNRELCQMAHWDPVRYAHKDQSFFELGMARAFREGCRILRDDGIGSVVFAHKTTEGWEALLSGIIRGGWTTTASWPITTESPTRLRARDAAALATSVHLVCRPRPENALVGDWGGVLRELPPRVADWMDRLQDEGVRGADLVFACIGPALEIFSRYSKVETAEGREVPLAEYLEKVWEVVGRAALNQVLGTAEGRARNGTAGALEEDARLTALFLWTIQSTEAESKDGSDEMFEDETEDEDEDEESGGSTKKKKKKGFSLIYDVARRFAQPLGIELENWDGRIIEKDKGIIRLLPVLERAQQLFGEQGSGAIADRLEHSDPKSAAAAAQFMLFPERSMPPKIKGAGRGRRKKADVPDSQLETRREATTLDRVHAAMLLQASGRANALRALLKSEIDRGPDFLRLANALSALYPQGSDEKRLLDAMLLAVPR